jgi:Tol biopolymer transport system component
VQLTNDPGIEGQPVFSPDGKTIFYHLEDANHKTTIWKVAVDGGSPERLTDFESARPSISPDGKMLAFRNGSADHGDLSGIGLLDLGKGGAVQKLNFIGVAKANYFRWSSDGRSLIYIDMVAGSSRLLSQPIAGGEPKLLAEFKGKRIYAFDISLRGEIAFALGSETSEGLMISNFR